MEARGRGWLAPRLWGLPNTPLLRPKRRWVPRAAIHLRNRLLVTGELSLFGSL